MSNTNMKEGFNLQMYPSGIPHVQHATIFGDDVLYEIAVVKENPNELYFIRLDELDQIDINRIRSVLNRRDAGNYPLWDLLDQTTFGNGMNGLEMFHQITKVLIKSSGKIMLPKGGVRAAPVRTVQDVKAAESAAKNAASAKRGPGRPPKSD